jgi:3-deoxy-D-manno-octulosonic-acid transferase
VYWLYNILILLFAPIWAPWMWWRSRKRKEQPNWKERQGEIDIPLRKDGKRIWFHAVSVGEVVAAMPILREIRKQLPEHEIVLSVTTSSGHQTAREKAEGLFDHLTYFPIDVARFQLAAMQRVRPSVVVVMETELWYNFLWAAKVFDARTLLVNGRISDRSFPRSKKIAFFYRALLKEVDRCLMQTDIDAERIKELGAHNVEVLGNSKFDQAVEGLEVDPDELRKELQLSPDKVTVVVGSTRDEAEEKYVVSELKPLMDRIQVIHAPRHLERSEPLAQTVVSAIGSVGLRSKGESSGYLVLDTYGELAKTYGVADIAIIGGGFSNLGGQNLIQPLAHGVPVIHGPYMQNFRDAADSAARAGATIVCSQPGELTQAVRDLIEHPDKRRKMGQAARELIQKSLGASARYGAVIAEAAAHAAV